MIGLYIADMVTSLMALFILLLCAVISRVYLKPSLPKAFKGNKLISLIWIPLLLYTLMDSPILFTRLATDPSQLQQVSGLTPYRPMTYPSGRRTSATKYLVINKVHLHCDYSTYDGCADLFVDEGYRGQIMTAQYQKLGGFGNLAYQIEVGSDTLYDFETQYAKYRQIQQQKRREWFWSFVLFGLIPFWFIKQDRRIYKRKQASINE